LGDNLKKYAFEHLIDANMVLGLFYVVLSTPVFTWHQQDEIVIITDEWKR
jgi:hypothetical protein